ncbi:MAG: NAD(P)-dependent oxidoreductase [Alphaproteobacteria bacterium]
MEKFRVALSGDFVKSDGKPTFPDFDLSPLDSDPRIDWTFIPADDQTVAAADLADIDALILLGARCGAASLPDNGRLGMVARFGVGYDNVDVDACTQRGIAVVITPDGVRRPVAMAIITFLLALSHRLLDKDRITRQGPSGWAQKSAYMGYGITGKTLGSLGIGNIGAEMFAMAAPFGMRFIAHDPFADEATAKRLGVELVGLDELFAQADYLTVNCPLTDATEGIVNRQRLALMKPTAFLINTARGPIVDQTALFEALKEKRIRGAGLDVFHTEPPSADEPILTLDNVLLAPHALCWTDQCFAGIGAADIRAVQDIMEGRDPTGVVNREILASDSWQARLERYRSAFSR